MRLTPEWFERVAVPAALLAILSCKSNQTQSARDSGSINRFGKLVVTETGLGPFRWDSSIASIRPSWPTSRDTTVPPAEGPLYAAVELARPGARIILEQFDTTLHANAPADVWYLSGDSIELPKGLRLTSRWGEIRKAYGPGGGASGDDVTYWSFNPCSVPYLFISFSIADLGTDSTSESTTVAAGIPDRTQPIGVYVVRDKTHYVPCDSTTSGLKRS